MLLLSVAVVCAGLIIAVSAAGTEGATYVDETGATKTATKLSEAVAGAKEGTTITLTGDTSVDALIAISKTLTIDLNGYSINGNYGDGEP